MTWKVHRIVQHAGDFDAVILHAKQDGMTASQADTAVGMKLRAQAPAAWAGTDLLEGGP